MLDGNHIDGFGFIIPAKQLKARPTESEGITSETQRNEGDEKPFN